MKNNIPDAAAMDTGLSPNRPEMPAGPGDVPDRCADPASESGVPLHPPLFPIVGLGASAGGLAAFEAFFSAIPPDLNTGMAFVLVQHLAPDHKSLLTELVKRYTGMRVQEVEDGMQVEPDCIYIIPPSLDMALFQGTLRLLEPTVAQGRRLSIDFFFRSLALDQHERAIGVLLSGSGSDGTLGARAIKGEGGLVMAQSPQTAAYDAMPRSVIATGLTDFVLPPAEMPAQLMAYVAHAFGKGKRLSNATGRPEDALSKICILLRDRTGHDFSQYKQSTLIRRTERRMALHQIDHQGDYVRYLQQSPGELDELFRDLLIGVTSFFRDPESFEVLERDVVPRLFAGKPSGAQVRVWVCGCSTGEEAYSIAILLQEHLETLKQSFRVQVFATDVDARAIERARVGRYPASIAADVSEERLARYFSRDPDGDGYRIQKGIRDLLIFSEQDVIKDPPFSRLDLISCRNLLIYFNGELQKRLMPIFHYALNPEGVLFLGNSETVGDSFSLFSPLNRKCKLFLRREHVFGVPAPAMSEFLSANVHVSHPAPSPTPRERRTTKVDLRVLTEQALLTHYSPVAILVNSRGDILHILGRTGQLLELPSGDTATNILSMARDGLARPLAAALHRSVARKEVVQVPDIRVDTQGDGVRVDLTVRPLRPDPSDNHQSTSLYLVVFESPRSLAASEHLSEGEEPQPESERDRRIADLELELRAKEEYLQTTLEEMETANEELKSTNEEMQSVNEELQSTNEELETSKEELQSVNEELATVNVELQNKVVDLSRANNDMNNLLAGTGVATLFVDHHLRITRFTPTATHLIKLIQTDIGRSVGDIVSNLVNYTDLVEDTLAVLKTLVPREQEVQTQQGDWYLMRIGPYRTLENVIEGAVITFVDISGRKHMEDALRSARAMAEAIVDTVREPLLVLSEAWRVVSANRAFYCCFQVSPSEILNQPLFELGDGQWDIPALRRLLLEIQSTGASFEDYEVSHDFTGSGVRTMRLNARRIDPGDDRGGLILLAIEDLGAYHVEANTASA
ncbi:chemotaxis protein CheB [Allochromatium vinosum]|uniref:protein-glutamate O-methyltransferase n=1 Tax=Allochromatium vinosum (strain ATCC 17899 / DSM 180 / NBRC 103801 / NCIMB 10441 / D) TaxID=572477 RepID=D3RSE9_ALLVD|nr:chemotaxis protein CheB [Allochromatium vinosum]ADC62108.1 MCP methyltransferase/methylesterase, CheR/CheB with PAS/PAC sensor [Allochromatium vinosum DSM 180]